MSADDGMSLIERRWTNTVIVEGKTYVLAQEAQVELRDTSRAVWDRVTEAEQQLEGAIKALEKIRDGLRGYVIGSVADLSAHEVFEIAENAADEFGGQ